MFYRFLILFLMINSNNLFAKEKTGVSFYVKDGNLIILDKINPRRIKFENIHTINRIKINMVRPQNTSEIDAKEKEPSIPKKEEVKEETKEEEKKEPNNEELNLDKKNTEKKPSKLELESKISKLIFDAKNAFFAEDYSESWRLINKAEKLSENDYRIKTMKGSLLFEAGDKDLAKKYWEESLKINPSQYDLIKKIKEIEEE